MFQAIIRVDKKEQAVEVSNEKEYPCQPEDTRRFQLEEPDWPHVNQDLRFGEGDETDTIFAVGHAGHVWDQTNTGGGGAMPMYPKRGMANQRFEYRLADRRLMCKKWGEPVTDVAPIPHLIGAPCHPDNVPGLEIRFPLADAEAKLKFAP